MVDNLLADGVVEIKLGGETHELKATVDAALQLCRIYGGLQAVAGKVFAYDVDAYITIIRLGLNLDKKSAEGLKEKVFSEGVTTLATALSEYVALLLNGGKRTNPEAPETKGEPSA